LSHELASATLGPADGLRHGASMRSAIVLCLVALLASACGDDQDPEGARMLWERIHAEGYRTWERAPGYRERQPSRGAHGDAVIIYVNDVVAETLAADRRAYAWPVGSIIVKDGFSGPGVDLIAAMEKRPAESGDDGQWFWVEWNDSGDTLYSGAPTLCTGCHRIGDDWVRGFFLP